MSSVGFARLARFTRRALLGATIVASVLTAIPMIAAVVTPSIANDADQRAYRLDAQDKIRLKVFEWRPSRDEVYEWAALNDSYVIGAGGRLSLPMIGEVAAAGLTTDELARNIADRMKTQIGLIEAPNISVEVVTFRPFYITGRVANPGEYAFRPGLTVLQAVSIAGGLYRGDRNNGVRLEREAIQGKGDLDLLSLERDSLLAKRARIEADLKNIAAIIFPPELDRDAESVQRLLHQETAILDSLRSAFQAQLEPLMNLKTQLQKESASLHKRIDTHESEMKLAEEELTNVKSLASKRLVAEQRRIGVQRNVYQLAADHMRLEMDLVRVQQEISRTDLQLSELKSKRANDLTQELRSTQAKLDEATRRYDTSKKLLLETAMSDGQLADSGEIGGMASATFRIVRRNDGSPLEMTAEENTLVEPGDTIKVDVGSPNIPMARQLQPGGEKFAPTKERRESPPFNVQPTEPRKTSERTS